MSNNNQILSRKALQSRIDKLARMQIAHLPTPLEFCPRLTKALAGPQIWMKRDDCTGLAFGGNKTRQLEFVFAETEGIILDPVYTSKAMAGRIDHIRQKKISKNEVVVFLHTGGTPALFAYVEDLQLAAG